MPTRAPCRWREGNDCFIPYRQSVYASHCKTIWSIVNQTPAQLFTRLPKIPPNRTDVTDSDSVGKATSLHFSWQYRRNGAADKEYVWSEKFIQSRWSIETELTANENGSYSAVWVIVIELKAKQSDQQQPRCNNNSCNNGESNHPPGLPTAGLNSAEYPCYGRYLESVESSWLYNLLAYPTGSWYIIRLDSFPNLRQHSTQQLFSVRSCFYTGFCVAYLNNTR